MKKGSTSVFEDDDSQPVHTSKRAKAVPRLFNIELRQNVSLSIAEVFFAGRISFNFTSNPHFKA